MKTKKNNFDEAAATQLGTLSFQEDLNKWFDIY